MDPVASSHKQDSDTPIPPWNAIVIAQALLTWKTC